SRATARARPRAAAARAGGCAGAGDARRARLRHRGLVRDRDRRRARAAGRPADGRPGVPRRVQRGIRDRADALSAELAELAALGGERDLLVQRFDGGLVGGAGVEARELGPRLAVDAVLADVPAVVVVAVERERDAGARLVPVLVALAR